MVQEIVKDGNRHCRMGYQSVVLFLAIVFSTQLDLHCFYNCLIRIRPFNLHILLKWNPSQYQAARWCSTALPRV